MAYAGKLKDEPGPKSVESTEFIVQQRSREKLPHQ